MRNIVMRKSLACTVASILMAILVSSIFSSAYASPAIGVAGLENVNVKAGSDLGRQAAFAVLDDDDDEDEDNDDDDDRKSNGNPGKGSDNKGKGNGNGAKNNDKNKEKDHKDEKDDDDDNNKVERRPVLSSLGSFELVADGTAIIKEKGRDTLADASLQLQASLERSEGKHLRFLIDGTVKLDNDQEYEIHDGHGSIIFFKNIMGDNSITGLLFISGKTVIDNDDGSAKFRLRALIMEDDEAFKILVFPAAKLGPHIRLIMEGTMTGLEGLPQSPVNKLHHFDIDPIPSTVAAGSLFNVTVTARTSSGSVLTSYEGHAKISDLTGTVKPNTAKFEDGIFKGTLNITKAISPNRIIFSDGNKNGTSNTFAVFAGPLAKIDLAPSEVTIAPGGLATFIARGFDKFGNEQSGLTFSWSLSSTAFGSIATSPNKANFTALSSITTKTNVTLTASLGSLSDKSTIFVNPTASQSLDHFVIGDISNQTAGSLFSITVRAANSTGSTVTSYVGPMKLSDTTGSLSMTVNSGFVNGVWTGNVNITKAGEDVKITASDASSPSKKGSSNDFDVKAAALHHFSISNIANKTAGVQFSFTVTAEDAFDNKKTDFLGMVTLTTNDGTSPAGNATLFAPNPYNFTASDNGEHTYAATMYNSKVDVTITATGSGKSGTSNEFDVNPAAAAKVVVTPKEGTAGPGGHVELNATSATVSVGSKVLFAAEAFDVYGNKITVTGSTPAMSFVWNLNPASLGTISINTATTSAEFTSVAGSGLISATIGSASGSATIIVT
jgi:hypothetical protein